MEKGMKAFAKEHHLTDVNLIIRQGVTDDVELEHAESL